MIVRDVVGPKLQARHYGRAPRAGGSQTGAKQ